MSPIPPNSTILITGVNGFIASHLASQLLALNHTVIGTVRTPSKATSITAALSARHPTQIQNFKTVVIPDISAPHALDSAIKGCDGVAHVASDLSFSDDPHTVIPNVVNAVRNVMASCAKEPRLKRFVYTSSSAAALLPQPNVKGITITENSWNDQAVKMAYSTDPKPAGYVVYSASKTEGEKEVWRFMKEENPHFEANAVLPNANFGTLIWAEGQKDASTSAWINGLYDSETFPEDIKAASPQYYINVADTARLHVAALVGGDVVGERIFGFAGTFYWDEILGCMRKVVREGVKVPRDTGDERRDFSDIVPRGRAEELLRKYCGRQGWTGLEESLGEHCKSLATVR